MRDITMVFTQVTYKLASALRTKISTLFLHHLNCKEAAAPPPGGGNGGGEFGGGLAPPPSDLPPNQAADDHEEVDDEFAGGTQQPRRKNGGGGGRRRSLIHRLLINSLWLKFFYLFSVSLFGFFLLLILDHNKLKSKSRKAAIGPFHLFFMSASATTISSMATAEMEDFTNAQLIVIIILMFVGGEIFTSMIHLQLQSHTYTNSINMITTIKAHVSKYFSSHLLSKTTTTTTPTTNDYNNNFADLEDGSPAVGLPILVADDRGEMECTLRSFKCLGDIMVGYLVIINLLGSLVVLAYVTFAKKARKIIVEEKGLNLMTFSVFAVVSSFANCGFLPTNENMIIFREHSFLCFLLMFLMLIGNTLFPPCLNLVVWALSKITDGVSEIRGFLDYDSWMKKCRRVGLDFEHLLPVKTSLFLMASVFGFIGLQFLLYCVLEWNDLKGDLDIWSRVVDGLFQAVSIRHAGEAVFDLSSFSPAILVFFMIMMYIPAYVFISPLEGIRTSMSSKDDEKKDTHDIELLIMTNGPPFNIDPTNTTSSDLYSDKTKKKKKTMISDSVWYWCKAKEGLESVMPSGPVVYLVLFVMIACITERKHMQMDPLNFNFLTVAFEVTSTFGSVGLSMGYSCKRLAQFESSSLNSNNSMSNQSLYNNCEETTASFCSKWSREGQILILLIMFYARLKNLTRRCGKAWITLSFTLHRVTNSCM